MATIQAAKVQNLAQGDAQIWLWEALTPTDVDGSALDVSDLRDIGIQVIGNFGTAGDIFIQGSIDGTTWAQLNDPQGNALSFTAAGIQQVQENVRYIRPFRNAGTGALDVDVYLIAS